MYESKAWLTAIPVMQWGRQDVVGKVAGQAVAGMGRCHGTTYRPRDLLRASKSVFEYWQLAGPVRAVRVVVKDRFTDLVLAFDRLRVI
jgi:hypothetical protein